jgi:hypothetical protein
MTGAEPIRELDRVESGSGTGEGLGLIEEV